MLKISRK